MKETKVTQYEATDGKMFSNRDEAIAYEAGLDAMKMIEGFLVHEEIDTQVSRSRTVNLIMKWEAYKAVSAAKMELKAVK